MADVRVAQFIPASAVRCSIWVYILLSVVRDINISAAQS